MNNAEIIGEPVEGASQDLDSTVPKSGFPSLAELRIEQRWTFWPNRWNTSAVCDASRLATGDMETDEAEPSDYCYLQMIQSSPELYEALRELVRLKAIKEDMEAGNHLEAADYNLNKEKAWQAARVALAKAVGSTSQGEDS